MPFYSGDNSPPRRRRRWWTLPIIVVAILLGAGAIGYFIFKALTPTTILTSEPVEIGIDLAKKVVENVDCAARIKDRDETIITIAEKNRLLAVERQSNQALKARDEALAEYETLLADMITHIESLESESEECTMGTAAEWQDWLQDLDSPSQQD